ncbi:hypothetical protein F5888DRAFT_1809330 [Russula emetica]|nr:hypothetical protein F5888DRAFT_1809330 [Russula emetica]
MSGARVVIEAEKDDTNLKKRVVNGRRVESLPCESRFCPDDTGVKMGSKRLCLRVEEIWLAHGAVDGDSDSNSAAGERMGTGGGGGEMATTEENDERDECVPTQDDIGACSRSKGLTTDVLLFAARFIVQHIRPARSAPARYMPRIENLEPGQPQEGNIQFIVFSPPDGSPALYLEIPIAHLGSLCERPRKYLRYLGVNGDGTRDVKTTRPGDEAAPEQDGDGANVQLHTHEREGEEAGDDGDGDEIPGTRQGA